MKPTIYYLTPDFDLPSWGIGLLYKHVEILRTEDIQAFVLHHTSGFSLDWLETDAPVAFLDDPSLEIRPDDMLVVPEVLAKEGSTIGGDCRRTVFVQGSYLILQPFSEAISYRDLGYEAAVAILFQSLEGGGVPPDQQHPVIEPSLVVRGSTGPAPSSRSSE